MEPPLNNGFPCVDLAGYVERALERATSPGQSKSLVQGLGRTVSNVLCTETRKIFGDPWIAILPWTHYSQEVLSTP